MNITKQSLELFLAYAKDADNWSGQPCVGANVGGSKEDRGNLSNLKVLGLIVTFKDDGQLWLDFTKKGIALALEHGIKI